MKDDAVYQHHIQECIRRIEENVAGGRERFTSCHSSRARSLCQRRGICRNWVRHGASRNFLADNLRKS